jgi:hypothetical protein
VTTLRSDSAGRFVYRLPEGPSRTLRFDYPGTRAGAVPKAGKLVTLQAKTPRGWRTFATARATQADGKWSYRYEFTQTTRTTRYAFRVVVPQVEAFPYVRGVSPSTTVLVRGS